MSRGGILSSGSTGGIRFIPTSSSGGSSPATAPVIVSAVVEEASPTNVVITFDRNLNSGSVPSVSSFSETGTGKSVINVAISGAVLTLTLGVSVNNGEVIRITYLRQDALAAESGLVASFADQLVTNNVTSSGPSSPPTVSLRTALNPTEVLPTFQVNVDYQEANFASVTASSLVVTDRAGAAMPISLDSAISNSGTIEATFTVTPTASVEGFYNIEAPQDASSNSQGGSAATYLGNQDVLLDSYPLVSAAPPTYPTAIESDKVNNRFSFTWAPLAGEVPTVYKGSFTSMLGQFSDDLTRGISEQIVAFDVDNNEIRIQNREYADNSGAGPNEPYAYNGPQFAPIAFTFNVGQSYDIEVFFRGTKTEVVIDTVSAGVAIDGRMGLAHAFGWRSTPPASVTSISLDQIPPEADIVWPDEPISFQIQSPLPVICGGTRGMPNRIFNWEVIDTVGTHLEGTTPARYRVFLSRDHAAESDTDDVSAAWADDLMMNGLTDFVTVFSSAAQVETPRLVWYDDVNDIFYIALHETNNPSSLRQSTVVFQTTDLVNFTNKVTALPADSGTTDTEARIFHTGYANPVELQTAGTYRAISLGANGDGTVAHTRVAADGFRSTGFISEYTNANPTSWTRIGEARIRTNETREQMSGPLTTFFRYNNNLYAVATTGNFGSNWSIATQGSTQDFSIRRVSEDLLDFSRRKDLVTPERMFWQTNARVSGGHLDTATGTFYLYVTFTRRLGNPIQTGVDDPMWVSVYTADLNTNSLQYASPSGIGFIDQFNDNQGPFVNGRIPDTNNTLGNSWEYVPSGTYINQELTVGDGYVNRMDSPNAANAGAFYGVNTVENFELSSFWYDMDRFDDTAFSSLLFDVQDKNNLKQVGWTATGRILYISRAGSNSILNEVTTSPESGGDIENRSTFLHITVIGQTLRVYRNMVDIFGPLDIGGVPTNPKVGFICRGRQAKLSGIQYRSLI